MVHLETARRQTELYDQRREEILSSGHRFAVIDHTQLSYFDTRKQLYREHPCFKPNAEVSYGTLPLLIDIGEEIDSLQYRSEKLEEAKTNFNEELLKLLKKGDRLAKRESKLEDDFKRDASRTKFRMTRRQYASALSSQA